MFVHVTCSWQRWKFSLDILINQSFPFITILPSADQLVSLVRDGSKFPMRPVP
jgi:hypothetical protein